MSVPDRHLRWEGCWNVRDLGGLPLAGGGTTRFGAVVRSDDPGKLTAAGWRALEEHGIRTVVSLRSLGDESDEREAADERARGGPGSARRSAELAHETVWVEDFGDREFVARFAESGLWATPLYYRAALERWPERSAAAIRAIAEAPPGGVLVHCGVGRDRTGLVVLLLLALCGVVPEAILADYELSHERMRESGNAQEVADIHALLDREGTTLRDCLLGVLDGLDVAACLREGGLEPRQLAAARARLLPSAGGAG